jgi:glycosyltransferase involved in cell wall biosynthesis
MIFLKWLGAALAQRLMLRLSLAASCAVAVSTEAWVAEVRSLMGDRRVPVIHLPSPSAIDRIPVDRQRARAELDLAPEEIVLCFFGTWHVSKMSSRVLDTLAMLLSEGKSARLLAIGSESENLLAQADEKLCPYILAPGYLDAETVSRALQASDLFLAPFSDGVSTRRTTVMAALEHGLAVVTTDGRLTDEIFRQSDALRLVPVDDAAAFLAEVRALAEDPSARRALGQRGRLFYEAHFSWPVITARLLDVMRAKSLGRKWK